MNFMPDDYNLPLSKDGYMRLEQGDNKIRILTSPIVGYRYWVTVEEKDKPKTVRSEDKIPMGEIERDGDPKHFWAMLVWNYELEQIQVLTLTQKSIQKVILSYSRNKDWGSPLGYDITINRTGERLTTEYQVMPSPKKELDEEVTELLGKTAIDLDALYSTKEEPYGGNPFEAHEKSEAEELADEVDKGTEKELTEVFASNKGK